MLRGRDFSHHDSAYNPLGYDFVWHKASEGTTFIDPTFSERWKIKGLPRGAYHYFHPSLDPIVQATLFRKVVPGTDPGELPPAIDLEVGEGLSPLSIRTDVFAFLETVEKLFQRRPLIYGPRSFLESLNLDPKYRLWIADPTRSSAPALPRQWTEWTFWQYAFDPDLDYFNGDRDTLLAL